MTTHKTSTGCITLIDRYRHGKSPKDNAQLAPAHITVEYDGWTTVWSFTGKMRDAAAKAAAFDMPNDGSCIAEIEGSAAFDMPNDGSCIAEIEGSSVNLIPTPHDFWIDTLARLGLSQAGAAKQLGVTRRAVEHWIAGTRPIPKMAELALLYLKQQKKKCDRPL